MPSDSQHNVDEGTTQQTTETSALCPDFYIKTLRIQGFRSLVDTTLDFQPTLNVIIGANNAGKTAIIDALRIILNLGSFQGKEDMIRLKTSDICLSNPLFDTIPIVFEATFHGKDTPDISAQFLELYTNTSIEHGYGLFQLRYQVNFMKDPSTGEYRYKNSQITGGTNFENPVSYETLDYIKSIYLAPLRDVMNDSVRLGREIERLLHGYGDIDGLKSIPIELREKAQELISAATENKHEAAAGKNLSKYASMYGIPENSLKFLPSGLSEDMLRSLQIIFNHGHHGPDKLGLANNGLGINNLIYASIVLSRDNDNAGNINKIFVLIEEPEAHLHPQSQESFFHEMNQITTHQIFVTSHSPTITAKCDIEKIIVMGHPCEDSQRPPCHIAKILSDKDQDKRYLHKFLDVTRSQLLFAKGAIFVEGVTEAMLLQVFSEILGCSLRAHGIEIISLGSNGGFDRFSTLLGADGLQMPCAFLTDGDEKPDDLPSDLATLIRKSQQPHCKNDGNIRIYYSLGTFEFELLLAARKEEMQKKLTDAMMSARGSDDTETNRNFADDFMDFNNPILSYQKMKQKTVDTGYVDPTDWKGGAKTNSEFINKKSEFAHHLLEAITSEKSIDFVVPSYIANAIKFVVNSDTPIEASSEVVAGVDDEPVVS